MSNRPIVYFVHDFALQNRLVTNGEYLAFIEDGGYGDFRHWLSNGWDTVQREAGKRRSTGSASMVDGMK